VRTYPKGFRWEHDGKPGLNGASRTDLLYGLERLSEKASPVFITEGPHCADALVALGLQAMATMTRAGSCSTRDALSILAGFPVVLWPDAV
jgi:hypothetical protein